MNPVKLETKGTSFTWNGAKRQLHMATSFGLLGWIANRQTDVAAAWLDRMQTIGMDGVRVFGEYKDWEENFFFSRVSPLYDVWDWEARRGSAVTIRPKMARTLRRAIKLLQQRGMVMEYVVSATAKALPVIPGFQDHMCRAIAQWFDDYEQALGPHNTLFEICNEYDVTRQQQLTANEIREIGRRWRVSRPENEDGRPDHPGSLLSISEGGEGSGDWDIEYPVETLSHVNIHSPRDKNWKDVGEDIDGFLKRYRKPVYLNENMHYMSKAEWDEWIPRIPGWAGLSSKDHKGIIEQATEAFDHKASYCLHFMTGMLTDPTRPMTKVELAWKEAFGPRTSPEPPPVLPSDPGPGDTPELPSKKGFWGRLLDAIVRGLLDEYRVR